MTREQINSDVIAARVRMVQAADAKKQHEPGTREHAFYFDIERAYAAFARTLELHLLGLREDRRAIARRHQQK